MEIRSKMKQEDKALLIKDLCARLPYGVQVLHYTTGISGKLHNINVYPMYEQDSDSDKQDNIEDYISYVDFFAIGNRYGRKSSISNKSPSPKKST